MGRMESTRIVHLRAAGVSVVVAAVDDGLPEIVHWGEVVDVDGPALAELVAAEERPGLQDISDIPYRPSILPEHSRGWFGAPGISAHRAGAHWAPRMTLRELTVDGRAVEEGGVSIGAGTVCARAEDADAGILVDVEIDLRPSGLLRMRAAVSNEAGADAAPLDVADVLLALPVPTRAGEVLDFSGRWGHERIPQRQPIGHGAHARVSRRGRTGLDATLVQVAGTRGFSSDAGEVWMSHVGFSGGHQHTLERSDGRLSFRVGEALLPGEVRLGAGERYETPWVYGSHGQGLDEAGARFHAHLRTLSRSSRRPRPVTLNVWEAVYFDQDPVTLGDLAAGAAELGVERYVLDDGWFRGRRDDRRGLGDWTPDPAVWPDGLRPLADGVRDLGMEFGLWVEPEMINEDSDLARAHPDWILRAGPDLPPRQRFQQVLDLTRPDAYEHILAALDGLVGEIGVDYLKWDHNRDLVSAGHPASGSAAVHEQTLAVYRLIDELRRRHPDLEIESCASGGGRVDLGILERADRVHPSDNHDPFDRFHNLRWTGLLVPPEMLGSHVASPVSSVTGRSHPLELRCAVAFLGHFGVEWDIRDISADDRSVLATWIERYRRHRGLIATGRTVTAGDDPAGPALRGVVAPDGSEALYTILTPATTPDTLARVRLPGLRPDARYRVTATGADTLGPPWQVPDWLRRNPGPEGTGDAPVLSGAVLSRVGLEFPLFHPDRASLVHAEVVS